MAIDFAHPVVTDLRADVLKYIRDAQAAQALMFDTVTMTSTPTGAIRYNDATGRFEKWNGTAWGPLGLRVLPGNLSLAAGAFYSGGITSHGFVQTMGSTNGYGGMRVYEIGGARIFDLLVIGATYGAALGGASGDTVLDAYTGVLHLATADQSRLRVESNGYVGIGPTGTAIAPLDLHRSYFSHRDGTFQTYIGGGWLLPSGVNADYSIRCDTGNITFGTVSVEAFRVRAGGGVTVKGGYLEMSGNSILGVANIGGHNDNGGYSIWGGRTTLNGGYFQLYGSTSGNPNIVLFGNSAIGETARFTAAGDLGIGTTAPGYVSGGRRVLDINGSGESLLALSFGGAGAMYFWANASYNTITTATKDLLLQHTGGERARIVSTGMTITGGLGINCATVPGVGFRAQCPGTNDTGLEFQRPSAAVSSILSYNRAVPAYNELWLIGVTHTWQTSGVTRMTLDAAGNLALTAGYVVAPAGFYGPLAGGALSSSYTWTGNNQFLTNRGTSDTIWTASKSFNLQAFSNDLGPAGMSFHRGGAYAVNIGLDADNYFRIGGWSTTSNPFQLNLNNGNLFIAGAVTAPRLCVGYDAGSGISTNEFVRFQLSTTGCFWGDIGQGLTGSQASYGNVGTYGVGKGNYIGYALGTTTVLMSDGGSNTGLWNSTQGWLWLIGTTDTHFKGNVIAYSATLSDRRLKKDIAPIRNALDRLLRIVGVTFKFIDGDRPAMGVIAQEVQAVFPELVREVNSMREPEDKRPPERLLTVAYAQLVAPIIEALREIDERLVRLES